MADLQTPPSDLQDVPPQADPASGGTPAAPSGPPSDLQDIPQPDPKAPFSTPGGKTYTPGQTVQHSGGTYGEVTGQHPDTGNAAVKWHLPNAKEFKVGEIVRVGGQAVTVNGYGNNGTLLVDNGKGGMKAVSPADVDDKPNAFTSGIAGVGQSLMSTIHGAADRLGLKSSGLDESKSQLDAAAAVNPNSGEAGHLVGDLVQFLALNGAVKAGTGVVTKLPAIDQYTQATKIVKVLADHPALAKLLHAGINGALTQGSIAGVQTGDATKTAEGAALGAGGEAAAEAAPAVLGAVGKGAKAVGNAIAHPIDTAGDVLGSAANLVGKGVEKATSAANDFAEKSIPGLYPKEIEVPSNVEQAKANLDQRIETQPAYDQHASDIRKAFVDGLKNEHGVDLQIPPDVDVRKLPGLAKTALKNEYQPLYGKVDEALENAGIETKYQSLEDDIYDKTIAAKEARSNSAQKPEQAISANKALADAKALKARADGILKDQGLDKVVDRATSLYKAAKASDEFNTKILSHTQDLNGVLPRTSPDGFNKALNNLKYKQKYQGNRLDQLLGEKAGAQLMADTRAAQGRVGELKDADKIRRAGIQDLKTQAREVQAKRDKVQKFAGGAVKSAIGGGILGEAAGLFGSK